MSTHRPFDATTLSLARLPSRASCWFHSTWTALALFTIAIVLSWLVCRHRKRRIEALSNLRVENQYSERTRITRDLNESLLQTLEASKMIAEDALDAPTDPVRMRRTMVRLLDWLGQAMKDGQLALDSLKTDPREDVDAIDRPLSGWMQKLHRRSRSGKMTRRRS
jgi:signal transduction histidine kinase